jgi:AraC-like DNA-binding protein
MHRYPLFKNELVSVSDLRCRNVEAPAMPEEESTSHQVVFVRSGMFVKHIGRTRIVAEPAHVVFFNKGETFRVSHPSRGDDCTSLACSPEITSVLMTGGVDGDTDFPSALRHARVRPSALIDYQLLRLALRDGLFTALEAEERTLNLLREIVRDALLASPKRASAGRRSTLVYRRRIVEETKLLLAMNPSASFSLTDLARCVASSPFHLSRIFRAETGIPIHQYLLRLRLGLALERLASGSHNLSELALSLGFASHSHFTTSFRQTFGISPSAFRQHASGSSIRAARSAQLGIAS